MILDALLAVGVILNAFKASDLLLRRGRQRGLPDLLQSLVRRLESHRPLEYLTRLASERGQRRLLLMGIADFLLVVAVDIAVEMWPGQSMTIGSFGVLVCAVAMALSLLSLAVVTRLGGLALVCWLVEDTRAPAFVRRFALVFAGGVAVLGIYQAALWGAAYLVGAGDPFDILELPLHAAGVRTWLVAIGLLAAWPPFVYFWILTRLGGPVDVGPSETGRAASERGSHRGGTPAPVRPRRVGGPDSGGDRRAGRPEADVGESQMTGRATRQPPGVVGPVTPGFAVNDRGLAAGRGASDSSRSAPAVSRTRTAFTSSMRRSSSSLARRAPPASALGRPGRAVRASSRLMGTVAPAPPAAKLSGPT